MFVTSSNLKTKLECKVHIFTSNLIVIVFGLNSFLIPYVQGCTDSIWIMFILLKNMLRHGNGYNPECLFIYDLITYVLIYIYSIIPWICAIVSPFESKSCYTLIVRIHPIIDSLDLFVCVLGIYTMLAIGTLFNLFVTQSFSKCARERYHPVHN